MQQEITIIVPLGYRYLQNHIKRMTMTLCHLECGTLDKTLMSLETQSSKKLPSLYL